MIVGRLFVALGIKGGKQSKKEVEGLTGALKNTKTMGLEAKAAILGAVYALEKMFAKSGQVGTDLTNFNATLGVSAKTLQQYQYAARQVGVSNEAVEGTFRGLQSTITNTLMGKGAPEGLARVAQVVAQIGHNMSAIDLNEFAEKPELLIQRLQEYARLEKNAGLRNATLKTFGIGDDMIASLTRNAYRPEVLNRAPTYSNSEIKSLDANRAGWDNLGNKIEMAFGRINAQHGGQLVKDLDKIATAAIKLSEQLLKTANDLKIFELISNIFKGWTALLSGDLSSMVGGTAKERYGDDGIFNQMRVMFDAATGADYGEQDKNKRDSLEQENALKVKAETRKNTGINAPWTPEELAAFKNKKSGAPVADVAGKAPQAPGGGKDISRPWTAEELADQKKRGNPFGLKAVQNAAMPPTAPTSVGTQNNTTTVNQNLNFQHDGKDAKQTGDSVKKAAQQAFRQMPAQAQGS